MKKSQASQISQFQLELSAKDQEIRKLTQENKTLNARITRMYQKAETGKSTPKATVVIAEQRQAPPQDYTLQIAALNAKISQLGNRVVELDQQNIEFQRQIVVLNSALNIERVTWQQKEDALKSQLLRIGALAENLGRRPTDVFAAKIERISSQLGEIDRIVKELPRLSNARQSSSTKSAANEKLAYEIEARIAALKLFD